MRIGILGGTFDPPHLGHLEFARAAMDSLKLDEVLFLPASRNPLKTMRSSPAKQRLEMVEAMIKPEPKMAVSDIEISRGGPSYMVETLMELQIVKPADYWLLLGDDALKLFHKWKNPHKVLKLCRLAVALRPPTTELDAMVRLPDEMRERVDIVPMKPVDMSATELRDRIMKGAGSVVAPFLSPAVLNYIKQNRLYRS
jgi:nicotinate-nucleotide adenylyltransferase